MKIHAVSNRAKVNLKSSANSAHSIREVGFLLSRYVIELQCIISVALRQSQLIECTTISLHTDDNIFKVYQSIFLIQNMFKQYPIIPKLAFIVKIPCDLVNILCTMNIFY